MAAIVFRNIGLDAGPRKLVMFRTDHDDLPHLTYLWNNPSGEVDVHLTPMALRSEHDREPAKTLAPPTFAGARPEFISACRQAPGMRKYVGVQASIALFSQYPYPAAPGVRIRDLFPK